jgi:hypothetical protein
MSKGIRGSIYNFQNMILQTRTLTSVRGSESALFSCGSPPKSLPQNSHATGPRILRREAPSQSSGQPPRKTAVVTSFSNSPQKRKAGDLAAHRDPLSFQRRITFPPEFRNPVPPSLSPVSKKAQYSAICKCAQRIHAFPSRSRTRLKL